MPRSVATVALAFEGFGSRRCLAFFEVFTGTRFPFRISNLYNSPLNSNSSPGEILRSTSRAFNPPLGSCHLRCTCAVMRSSSCLKVTSPDAMLGCSMSFSLRLAGHRFSRARVRSVSGTTSPLRALARVSRFFHSIILPNRVWTELAGLG